jgi:FkbM family methyltransferase
MKTLTYNGIKLFIPERYYNKNLTDRFVKNRYESEEDKLCNHFNKNDTILELGSCLGYITNKLSQKCNQVISVEANPELRESLEMMKRVNQLDNVTLVNAYISNEKKEIDFQTYDIIVAGSGDREDLEINNVCGWGDTLKIYKMTSTLLTEIPNITSVNSMMIDIEGGELDFITNHKDFIESQVKKIVIELHGRLMKDKQFDNKCIQLLLNYGFILRKRGRNSYYFEKQ